MKNSQGITGVPVGVKIVSIDCVSWGESYIDRYGSIAKWTDPSRSVYPFPIVASDNCYNVIDLASVPIPEGFRRKGATVEEWYRMPRREEWVIGDISKDPLRIDWEGTHLRIILEPIPKRRVLVVEVPLLEKEEVRVYLGASVYIDNRSFTVPPTDIRIEERE